MNKLGTEFLNMFITFWLLLHCYYVITIFQIENMKCKDQRLKIMNEILNGIKVRAAYALLKLCARVQYRQDNGGGQR